MATFNMRMALKPIKSFATTAKVAATALILLAVIVVASRAGEVSAAISQQQGASFSPDQLTGASGNGNGNNHSNNSQHGSAKGGVQKCTRQSMILARQTLMNELELVNNYSQVWFSDLDKDELLEEQKQSLGNIIMSGSAGQLLNGDGQPLFELEASYFRPTGGSGGQPISIKLVRRHPDRCYLHHDKAQFTYVLGLSVGPIEHYLDLVYNFPKELRLSQPISWRRAQVRLSIPRMQYEITLKQTADYSLNGPLASSGNLCPLEVSDVTYLSNVGSSMPAGPVGLVASGLATTNQTSAHLERLFNDYTRPTVSGRLRQLLKFYLNSKTLPLAS